MRKVIKAKGKLFDWKILETIIFPLQMQANNYKVDINMFLPSILALWSQEVLKENPFPLVWDSYRNKELEGTLLTTGHNLLTLEMRKLRPKWVKEAAQSKARTSIGLWKLSLCLHSILF